MATFLSLFHSFNLFKFFISVMTIKGTWFTQKILNNFYWSFWMIVIPDYVINYNVCEDKFVLTNINFVFELYTSGVCREKYRLKVSFRWWLPRTEDRWTKYNSLFGVEVEKAELFMLWFIQRWFSLGFAAENSGKKIISTWKKMCQFASSTIAWILITTWRFFPAVLGELPSWHDNFKNFGNLFCS